MRQMEQVLQVFEEWFKKFDSIQYPLSKEEVYGMAIAAYLYGLQEGMNRAAVVKVITTDLINKG